MTPTNIETRQRPAESIRSRSVVPLSTVTRADVTYVGQKAANLGELRQAGHPVPDGVILTTRAWESMLAGYEDAEITAEAIWEAVVPD
jgi:phosphoenolpyruvate synthase/pyruvate phosphate dikinase